MRLMGFHINQVWGGIPEFIASKKPSTVVVIDGDSNTWGWVKKEAPKTILTLRPYTDKYGVRIDGPSFSEPMDAKKEAEAYIARVFSRNIGAEWDYVIGVNEPVIDTEDAMKRLAEFEIERMRALDKRGHKAAIASLAVGNPPDMSLWRHFIPAFDEGLKYKAVLSLHEYGYPYSLQKEAPWLILRHRKLYDGERSHGWEGLPQRLKSFPLIVTETGGDQLIWGTTPGGFKYYLSPEQYILQLKWLDAELMKDEYVIGSDIFCCGTVDAQWMSYDVWSDVAFRIGGELYPLYRNPYAEEPQGNVAIGPDVSWHQKMPMDWEKMKADGVSFAIIRSSYRLSVDTRFEQHYNNAGKAGLLRGMYHYIYPEQSPRGQARVFAQLVEKYKPELPAFLDVEQEGVNESGVLSFIDEFRSVSGKELGIYTSMYKWHKLIGRNKQWAKNMPLWVADWGAGRDDPRMPTPWKDWKFWQYTSSGRLDGYNGRLDLNRFNGSEKELFETYGKR